MPQALGHHLAQAGRLRELRQLLMSPSWLEQKLQAYGRVAVVADFRRYSLLLSVHGHHGWAAFRSAHRTGSGLWQGPACTWRVQQPRGIHMCRYLMLKPDEEVKLILDAFQMSVSACAALPGTRLLRAQMQGRLMQVDADAAKVSLRSSSRLCSDSRC